MNDTQPISINDLVKLIKEYGRQGLDDELYVHPDTLKALEALEAFDVYTGRNRNARYRADDWYRTVCHRAQILAGTDADWRYNGDITYTKTSLQQAATDAYTAMYGHLPTDRGLKRCIGRVKTALKRKATV